MKNLIFIIIFTYCALHISARTNTIQVRSFLIEGTTIYNIKGCLPKSQVYFYSQKDGGDILQETTTDQIGSATLKWEKSATPAFLLNTVPENDGPVEGNGMVQFIHDPEFTLKNITLENSNSFTTLSWNAEVAVPGSYSFQVLKSISNSEFKTVQSFDSWTKLETPYAFNDLSHITGAFYELRVIDKDGNPVYTSEPFSINGNVAFSLYPTATKSDLFIHLNETINNAVYRIINVNGKTIQSGNIDDAVYTCHVSSLSPGNYLIEIIINGKKSTAKFIKE